MTRHYKCWRCKDKWYKIEELIKVRVRNSFDYNCPKCEGTVICGCER